MELGPYLLNSLSLSLSLSIYIYIYIWNPDFFLQLDFVSLVGSKMKIEYLKLEQ